MKSALNKVWGPTGHGPPPTDDLTPPTREALFRYQLAQAKPFSLTPESLLVAKICETRQYADSVFSSCQKAHVISAAGLPDTTRIDASLVSKIAIISVPKQRELVNMLFFWEEEATRLRLLDTEEEGIKAAIGSHGETEDLSMALKVVRGKKQMIPSLRKNDGTANADEALPAYGA